MRNKPHNWITDEIEFLKQNYAEYGGAYCASKLNVPRRLVTSKVQSLGLKVSPERKYGKNTKDISNFLIINKPETAYVLGFLWADGHITNPNNRQHHTITMKIRATDADDIMSTMMNVYEWNVYYSQKKNPSWSPVKDFNTGHKALHEILVSLDYHKKSGGSANKVLSAIPNELRQFWWRGYFDGDGCLYQGKTSNHLSFTAPIGQNWDFCVDLLEILGITQYQIKPYKGKKSKRSVVRIYSWKQCKTFLDYVYESRQEIGLRRKYIKYLALISKKRRYHHYTENELEYIRQNYEIDATGCASFIGVSVRTLYAYVNARRTELGLIKPTLSYDVGFVIRNHTTLGTKKCAELLGVSYVTIRSCANRLRKRGLLP